MITVFVNYKSNIETFIQKFNHLIFFNTFHLYTKKTRISAGLNESFI